MRATCVVLKYSDIAGLERSIDSAYSTASARLFEVFTEKFRLLDHLSALRHYLLLGYGDFAEQLMEALGCVVHAHQLIVALTHVQALSLSARKHPLPPQPHSNPRDSHPYIERAKRPARCSPPPRRSHARVRAWRARLGCLHPRIQG